MLEELIKIEALHRFVFDKLYVQLKLTYTDEEKLRLKEYNDLSKLHPKWRTLLIIEYKKNPTDRLKKILRVNEDKKSTRYGSLELK